MVRFGRGFPLPRRLRQTLLGIIASGTSLTIDGVPKRLLDGWRITESLNNQNTMRFSVLSLDGTYRPSLRDNVIFTYQGTRLFAGLMHHMDEAGLGGQGTAPIEVQCGATDYSAYLAWRRTDTTLSAGSLKSMLVTLVTKLSGYGVTLDASQVTGPSLAEQVFERPLLRDVFDRLSTESGYAYEIDYYKVLRMFPLLADADGRVAPFSVIDGDGNAIGDITVSPTVTDYANHITVWYTEPAVAAYAFFQLTAVPSADETVTVGAVVYVWKVAAGGGTEVTIGGTIATSIDNLVAAVHPSHPEVVGFEHASDTLKVTAQTAGASGNSIQVATTCANGTWSTEGGGLVSTLRLGADAALVNYVIAQDVGEQNGGANLVEKVYEEPDITDGAAAQDLADSYLLKALVQPREVRYTTLRSGVRTGMVQLITIASRGINNYCLVTNVEIMAHQNVLRFEVTAVESDVIPTNYRDIYREWAG